VRIGIVGHSSVGGSARIAADLACQLARRGHRVHAFARREPFGGWDHASGAVLHQLAANGETRVDPTILRTDWPRTEFRAFVSDVLRVVVEERLDLLHFHYAAPFAFLAREIRNQLGAAAPALVGTLHGTDVTVHGRDPHGSAELAAALREVDALTAVSNGHAQLAADVFRLPAPEVIANFVDLARFGPGPGPRALRPSIAHVSNFRTVKDPVRVARIFRAIRQRTNAELWLIGDGPEMHAVRSALEESRLAGDVRFWGLRRDVPSLLARADLLLVTSLYESFCLAALEAMASGVPVVATDVGGLPEVVAHGETGFLFPVNDDAAAVELALDLLSRPRRRDAMGRAARMRAERFGHDRIVSMYEGVYHKIARRHRSRCWPGWAAG
jgi:N-acetyl-alpha-D-glucosaminyl L-malate synthase BshA